MKPQLKLALVGAGAFLVFFVLVVFFLSANLDKIVKVAVEKTLTYVLEVDVTLRGVEISPTSGEIVLQGLVIGNPEGFNTASAMEIGEARVRVDLKSFTSGEPTIHLASLSEPKITLEQGLHRSNLSELVKSASRFGGDGSQPAAPEPAAADDETEENAEMRIRIDKVLVTDATVALSAPILQGKEISYTLGPIEMNDLGGKDGDSVTVAEAIEQFFTEILTASVEEGSGVMPDDLKQLFDGSLADVTGGAEQAAEKVQAEIDQETQKLEEAAGKLGDSVDRAKEGLSNLLKRDND